MAKQPMRVVAAACDGACSGNPGPGGWGALLRYEDGSLREMGGAERATTNNRMELTAALALFEVLRELPRAPDLVIRTDSRYLIDGLQKWLAGWKRKGWRTASGGAVLNRDLWEQLDAARLPGVSLVHVRGHSGDPDNDRCDAIAVAFSRGQRPALASPGTPAPPPPAEAESSPPVDDPAPVELQQLLGRLELADRLARGGYGLSLVELAGLVDMPLRSLESRTAAWTWRDWRVLPIDGGRWRLERDAGGLASRE
jgi:ribonuclease HI